MSNEELKEISRCILDGEIIGMNYRISKKSTRRLLAICNTSATNLSLDSELFEVISDNRQFFSLYGITLGKRIVLYNGDAVYYTF